MQDTGLTLDKKLNSSVYGTLCYVNNFGGYKLLKAVWFYWATLYIRLSSRSIKRMNTSLQQDSSFFSGAVVKKYHSSIVDIFLRECANTMLRTVHKGQTAIDPRRADVIHVDKSARWCVGVDRLQHFRSDNRHVTLNIQSHALQ